MFSLRLSQQIRRYLRISLLFFVYEVYIQCAAAQPADAQQPHIAVHQLSSVRQSKPTTIRVLLPDSVRLADLQQANAEPSTRFPVLYVLPVEASDGQRWGDSLAEVQKYDLHNRHQVICVFPTFADLPWYADHPSEMTLHQESYFLQDVLPLVEKSCPARNDRDGRMLVGFSKSGWGAWSLLLRHPDVFGKAAAFDAPMMLNEPGKYGSGPIFGSAENFRLYQVSTLLNQRQNELSAPVTPRLALFGQGNFEREHESIAAQARMLEIPLYRFGTTRIEHSWNSGWLPSAVDWLLSAPGKGSAP